MRTPKHVVELRGTEPGDRLVFPVSTAKKCNYGSFAQALATRLASRNNEFHAISGITPETTSQFPQDNIKQATFLVAGYLQRWTLYILELAKIMRVESIILEKLSKHDSSWEKFIPLNVGPSKTLRIMSEWEQAQHKAYQGIQQKLIKAIKAALTRINQFEEGIEAKIHSGDNTWEQDIRDHIKFSGRPKDEAENGLQAALAALAERVISTANDSGNWKVVYKEGMFELFRSGHARAIFTKEEDWVKIFEDSVWELCASKSKVEGANWIKQFRETVATGNKLSLIEDEHSDTDVFYKLSSNGKDKELDVVSWEDIVHDSNPGFVEKRKLVQEAFDANTQGYKDIVEQAARSYLETFIEENRKKGGFPEKGEPLYEAFYQKATRYSIEYILEESAVFWIYIESGKIDGLAYPFKENQTNGLLYQCIAQLCAIVKDKNRSASDDSTFNVRPVTVVYGEVNKPLQQQEQSVASLRQPLPQQEAASVSVLGSSPPGQGQAPFSFVVPQEGRGPLSKEERQGYLDIMRNLTKQMPRVTSGHDYSTLLAILQNLSSAVAVTPTPPVAVTSTSNGALLSLFETLPASAEGTVHPDQDGAATARVNIDNQQFTFS